MTLARVEVKWTGTNSDPGLSVFNIRHSSTSGDPAAVGFIRAFFANIAAQIPNDVTLSFPSLVELYDEVSGQLVGEETFTAPSNVVGSDSGLFADGVGVRVDWLTGAIREGRRVRGRTFIVPAAAGCFTNSGEVATFAKDTITTAANGLISSLGGNGTALTVWSRPPVGTKAGGALTDVIQAAVPNKAAWLKGRRG
jgi:hypothetical protein